MVLGKVFGNFVRGITPGKISKHDYLVLINQKETIPLKTKSYFIFRTGGGGYRDIPQLSYHFRGGIPGYRQVLDAENNGDFVYYDRYQGRILWPRKNWVN